MTTTPAWLYHFFAVLMLVVAAYSVVLLIATLARRQPAGFDVAISHTFMGVSMAGMFEDRWAFGPSTAWEISFAVLLIWFLVRSVQSVQHYGLHLSHSLIHAVMNFAMLLMYWFPMQATAGSTGSMSMSSASAGSKLDPGLSLVLVVVILTSAVFTLASPNKGASHHGAHVRAYAMSATSGSAGSEGRREEGVLSAGRVEGLIATPWLEDASHVVMCVAMAFMLVLML